MAELMTTGEVAAYLRIKERKVYELVRERRIPCSRAAGKWLFPRHLVDLWVIAGVEGAGAGGEAPPPIVAGSQDPLLDWALQELGSELAMFACGSTGGLERLADGKAVAAGLHLLDPATGEYNVPAARRALGTMQVVLIEWGWRTQGLVVARGNPLGLGSVADLARPGVRVARRQEGAGAALLLDHLLAEAGVTRDGIGFLPDTAKGETELGLAVLEGRADAGLAVAGVAGQLRLDFVPLARERFDLAIRRRDYFEPPIQRLLAFARSEAFVARAADLGGYDIADLGRVAWNGP